jgi:hypothetical protein
MKWYILYTRHYHERAVHERMIDIRISSIAAPDYGEAQVKPEPAKGGNPAFPTLCLRTLLAQALYAPGTHQHSGCYADIGGFPRTVTRCP